MRSGDEKAFEVSAMKREQRLPPSPRKENCFGKGFHFPCNTCRPTTNDLDLDLGLDLVDSSVSDFLPCCVVRQERLRTLSGDTLRRERERTFFLPLQDV